MQMHFAFTDLSIELALEIVRLASFLVVDDIVKSTKSSYATAVALASVSYRVRQATMPHLLHTVILNSASSVHDFIGAIHIQKEFNQQNSRLKLDYRTLVRRLWSTECWDGAVDELPCNGPDYASLYPVLSGLDSLGLNFKSLSLLYNGLAHAPGPLKFSQEWQCRRVTLAGPLWRWKPLTSTPEGLAFLGQVTHLTLWIPDHTALNSSLAATDSPIPRWVQYVPFAFMPNLTHFACPLFSSDEPQTFTQMIVYRSPVGSGLCHDPAILRQRVLGPEPLTHGIVVQAGIACADTTNFQCEDSFEDSDWERAYMLAKNESIWKEAEGGR